MYRCRHIFLKEARNLYTNDPIFCFILWVEQFEVKKFNFSGSKVELSSKKSNRKEKVRTRGRSTKVFCRISTYIDLHTKKVDNFFFVYLRFFKKVFRSSVRIRLDI